ncbi:winged helix-turn-helix domain-containing protein [Streptomyces sp. NPDC060006]|uniref:winged helix-turn-helix domain-containing protein n=1 Tax=unclassified Streptomyces TaxID=2593676 RepID=UPI00364281A8
MWARSRIKTLIGRRFHESFILFSGIAQMLHRHGFSHQASARRTVERDRQTASSATGL